MKARKLLHRTATTSVLLLSTVSCDTGSREGARAAAGAAPAAIWRVAAEPRLRLNGNDTVDLGDVAGLARLSSEDLVVAVSHPVGVHLFAPGGTYRRTFGRRGDGPGEFRTVEGLALLGDSLVVFDLEEQAHHFAPDGRFLRRQPRPEGGGDLRGMLATGDRVVRELAFDHIPHGGTGQTTETLLRVSTSDRQPLGTFPSMRMTRAPNGQSIGDLFSPSTRVAVFPDGVCAGHAGGRDILCVDAAGDTVGTIEVSGRAAVPVRIEDIEAYFFDVYRANPSAPKAQNDAEVARLRERLRFASELGIFGRLLAARDGRLWVGPPSTDIYRWANPHAVPDGATTWSVFERTGAWVADIELPPRVLPFDVGADHVLGVTRDADDEVVVVLFDIVK
jgi:hypothetical protein